MVAIPLPLPSVTRLVSTTSPAHHSACRLHGSRLRRLRSVKWRSVKGADARTRRKLQCSANVLHGSVTKGRKEPDEGIMAEEGKPAKTPAEAVPDPRLAS